MTCGASTLEEVVNMVKIVASNQQENARKIKEEIKDEIRDVKKMIASGFEETNTTRLEKVVKEMKDEMKNEVDLLSEDMKTLLVSGSVQVNNTRLEDVFNEIKDVKALLESGSGDINEMRLEDILKEIKDLKKVIASTSIEVEPSKQALVSALLCEYLVMVAYVIGQTIIFLPCDFYILLSFFFSSPNHSGHRLEIGCLPYFHTRCGPSANLECMSEMCCTWLAGNTGRKVAILAPSHNFVVLYLRN